MPISCWNVRNEKHRTNNISESFNRELRHYFKKLGYFNGKKSLQAFERSLTMYINYRSKCEKLETTKKRNKTVEVKDILISNINNYEKEFNEKQLLITLTSITQVGRHINKNNKNNEKVQKEIEGECQEIDEENFETKDDKYIDNFNGSDGIGNDITEFIKDNNGILEKIETTDETEMIREKIQEILEGSESLREIE